MRTGNLILVAICTAAVLAAVAITWRGRRLPVIAPRAKPTSASSAAFDALRTLACVLTAGFIAGVLVVGFGGRLVMRVLAATSGVFGLLLLASFGVSDPLPPDNVDFAILNPTWLAVTLVCLTALLFGATFSALVARFDATLVPLNQLRSEAPRRRKLANASLVWLLIALPLAAPATVYVAGRAISHGRLDPVVNSSALRFAGYAAVAVGAVVSALAVFGALSEIV